MCVHISITDGAKPVRPHKDSFIGMQTCIRIRRVLVLWFPLESLFCFLLAILSFVKAQSSKVQFLLPLLTSALKNISMPEAKEFC